MNNLYTLSVPSDLKNDFFQGTCNSNHRILKLLIFFISLAQLFNLFRVLFLSDSGLHTVNNRIYFSFYCFLLLISLIYIPVGHFFKDHPKRQLTCQMALCLLWLLWSAGLNLYDMIRQPQNTEGTIFLFSLLMVAVCVQMIPAFFIPAFSLSGLAFIFSSREILRSGELLNIFFFVCIAQLIAYARFHYTLKDMDQARTIRHISKSLEQEKEKLDLSLKKYHYIVSESKNIIVEWDRKSDTAVFSGNWQERFHYPSVISGFTQWLGSSPILGSDIRQKLTSWLLDPSCTSVETELEIKTTSGESRWFLLHFSFQEGTDGQVVSGIGYLSDISSQKQEILSLKSKVMTDTLTGLLNRRAIRNYMTVHPHLLDDNIMTVMFIIDLDNFKQINDTYGHPCGDYVLVQAGAFLKNLFRKTDAVGRLGGDEFIILMYARRNRQLVTKKAREMTQTPLTVQWNGVQIPVGFSVGVSVSFQPQADYDLLYKSADGALYEAKQNCKGNFVIRLPDGPEADKTTV